MIKTSIRKKLVRLMFTGFVASLGIFPILLKAKPTLSAERISFSLPVLGEFNLSIDSLEIFAKEGKITKDFAFYARFLDEQTLTQGINAASMSC